MRTNEKNPEQQIHTGHGLILVSMLREHETNPSTKAGCGKATCVIIALLTLPSNETN